MNTSISVTKIYPIREMGCLIASLPSFDWEFGDYGPVWLCLGNEKIEARYIGSGNQGGCAVVRLSLKHPATETINKIEKLAAQLPDEIRIERINHEGSPNKKP